MPSPFPGMDPYLEGPLWMGFHTQFCVEIARYLVPELLPRYLALTEKRLATTASEQRGQITVEIREAENRRLVTTIETLSPANKKGPDREEYLAKRDEILLSSAHLIEIDLLRGGERVPMRQPLPSAPYFVLISRAQARPILEVWPIALGSTLPKIPVPLLAGDADVQLDLQAIFDSVYDSFAYSAALRYTRKLQPALTAEEQTWVNQRLKQAGKFSE